MRVHHANPHPARRLLGAALAAVVALVATNAAAFARDSYVQDGAAMFGQSTVAALNAKIAAFNSQTGKEIVIVTVPSLDGATLQAAAEKTFAAQQVNGVLFFFAKAEQQDLVVGDRASRAFFPSGTFTNVHTAMRGYFRDGDFDTGLTTGVNLVLDQYQGHQGAQPATAGRAAPVTQPTSVQSTGGSHMSFIWLLLILLAGFLIIRALFRAMSRPRMMPPGYGPGAGPMPGAGGPGYGGGYGYGGGGGGGSFFSGLLGGLGGAFLGNELFGNRGGGGTFTQSPTDASSIGGGGAAPDAGGWQSDAGQADMGNAGGGDWSSGGGFDAGSSGGFDGGGGGGFDGGGGGGDSGGGW